ncbi:dihydrodipicolinate reductase [Enterocloster asparagiformis]|uniref:dihydrodipicolinate reductase n=1 Tax=Enterocloster asparagiformis TaxID=333367 RepID=UPI002A7EB707|nr:dihydrodipicolinate reductase [Enterocloster asparagiformis]
MTQLREQAIEMIKEIPEDKIIYVVNILKNVRDLSGQPQADGTQEMERGLLLEQLKQYRGRLSEDFDYKKELEEARDEKYADFA